jgi:hypothetical protein
MAFSVNVSLGMLGMHSHIVFCACRASARPAVAYKEWLSAV